MEHSKGFWRGLFFIFLITALCGGLTLPAVSTPARAAPQMQLACGLMMAQWTFDPTPASTAAPLPSTANVTVSSNSGSGLQGLSFTGTGAVSGNAWTADHWSTGSIDLTKFFEFDINTSGYSGIVLTFVVSRSGSGPTTISVQYSTDGVNYTELQTNSISAATPTLINITANFSSIAALDNNTNAKFRVYGYSASGVTGSMHVDNVTFTGCQPATPTSTPTDTGTPTSTGTPTNTGTATNTGMPTNTSTATATATNTSSASTTNVVISEFRTRGPGGASDEFIELYNPTSNWIDISGWKINASNNAGAEDTRATIPVSTILRSGQYYLVANNSYSNTNVPANLKYGTAITDDGGIALIKLNNTMSDEVGMDAGSAYQEGTTLSPLSGTSDRSYERKLGGASDSCVDTNDNASDFITAGSGSLHNYSSPLSLCGASRPTPSVTTTTITGDSPDPSVTNGNVTVSVKVTGGSSTPSGLVNITGANTNCTITLNTSGTGSCIVKFTSTGTKGLIATYLGDNTHAGSTDTEPHQVTSTTFVPTRTPKPTPLPPQPLIGINEFVPRPGHDWNNDGVINAGDEYIEILNHGVIDVNLGGYSLDDEANIGSEPFPLPGTITLKPGERHVFYGSETGLLLSDGGDGVRLLKPNGQLLDAYNYFVVRFPDQSYCRLPDNGGLDDWNQNCFPTPGLQNSLSGTSVNPPTENGEQTLCPIADTLPNDFVLAECRPFGNNIWNPAYWDRFGWFDEKYLPESPGKWPIFAE